MKKRTILLLLLLLAALGIGAAVAAGGGANDPLVSLDYLTGVFGKTAQEQVDTALDAADAAVYDRAAGEWQTAVDEAARAASYDSVSTFIERRISEHDSVSGPTGLQIVPLAGVLNARFDSGAVIDVTDGTELASGDPLTVGHRYLVGENTLASFVAASRTALFNYCGYYVVSPSGQPDYAAIADALHGLGTAYPLFRGTDSPLGKGYELERTPTRVEALVMLLRLLGEEAQALECREAHPFNDVPAWAEPYVAYAYQMGYSNGVSATQFGAQTDATADMFIEFVLRALAYSSTAQTDISDAGQRACAAGVLTEGERALFADGRFYRADVAYLSYYALSARVSGSSMTLAERLIGAKVFSAADYSAAQSAVTTARIR